MTFDNKAFKALGDSTRREILGLLHRGEMTAGDLAERFDMTKPSMSHHFSVLKDADLISSRRDGQQIWYSLNTTVVQDLVSWAMDLVRSKEVRGKEAKSNGRVPRKENRNNHGNHDDRIAKILSRGRGRFLRGSRWRPRGLSLPSR